MDIVLVQLGDADDVPHKLDEALGFIVNFAGKVGHVRGGDHAAFHNFGDAGDGGEGSLELVGHIGAEFPPQALPFLLFGHVQQHQHDAGEGAFLIDGVGKQLADAPVQGNKALHMLALLGAVQAFQKIGLVGQIADVVAVQRLFRLQKAGGTGVIGEHQSVGIQHQKALPHVVGDGGELALLGLQLLDLLAYLPVLMMQAAQERLELFVGCLIHLGMLQIDLVEGLGEPLAQLVGDGHRHQSRKNKHQQQRRREACQQRHAGIVGAGDAEDLPVFQQHGAIDGLLGQRFGIAAAFAGALGNGLDDFRPVGVVFHLRGVGVAVKENGAVGVDKGQPVLSVAQMFQIVQALPLHVGREVLQLVHQLVGQLRFKIGEQDGDEQGHAYQQGGEGHRHHRFENTFAHWSFSRMR